MANFTGRDLALLLPDKFDVRNAEGEKDTFEPLKPKIDQTKRVTRYFPGKAPVWVGPEARSADDYIEVAIDRTSSKKFVQPVVEDRRLARLAKVSSSNQEDGQNDESAGRGTSRRRVFEAEIVDQDSGDEFQHFLDDKEDDDEGDFNSKGRRIAAPSVVVEDNGEDDVAERRSRILKKAAEKQLELAASKVELQVESESEYETDTDEEDEEEEVIRPVFIPKAKRETIKEQELKLEQAKIRDEKKLLQEEDRKRQTLVMVAESIRRNQEMADMSHTDADSDAGLPDDSDDLDDPLEYENWTIRETSRLMRDAEQREMAALEKADLERRRLMTDEQRISEDKRLGVGKYGDESTGTKEKWGFMQKYYHKGVFYMDDDSLKADGDVRKNNFNEPTLEDKFDKEKLPAVLQVKNFGKRGRTKYTHLADQDTTKFKERLDVDERLRKSYLDKRSGVGSLDDAGRLHKKIRDDN